MKKILILVITVVLLFLIFFFFFSRQVKSIGGFEVKKFTVDDRQYRLLVADTPEKWEKGLMFFRKLNGASGMMFIFPDTNTRTFWNKNTFLDLDVYWINDEKVVGKSFLPSIEMSREVTTVSSPQPVNRVVELVK